MIDEIPWEGTEQRARSNDASGNADRARRGIGSGGDGGRQVTR